MADPHVVSFVPAEMCLLSNNIRDYYFVAQGKTTIPGLDDGEELLVTDVSACFYVVGSRIANKPLVFSIRAHQFWTNSANRPLRATCFSVFVMSELCCRHSLFLRLHFFISLFIYFSATLSSTSLFLSLYFFCFSLHTHFSKHSYSITRTLFYISIFLLTKHLLFILSATLSVCLYLLSLINMLITTAANEDLVQIKIWLSDDPSWVPCTLSLLSSITDWKPSFSFLACRVHVYSNTFSSQKECE